MRSDLTLKYSSNSDNSHIYVHTHTHLHTHIHIHTHTYSHTHTYTHTHTHTQTHKHTHTHTHTQSHTHTQVGDLAMKALRGAEAASQEDEEGDGSWILPLQKVRLYVHLYGPVQYNEQVCDDFTT